MARTLVVIEREMEKLKREADAVRAKEVVGVISRIRTAIEFYGLTAADLLPEIKKKVGRPQGVGGAAGNNAGKKKAAMAKFKDAATGKTWTGHGKRPGWYVLAIEAGRKPEDLAISG